MVLSSLCTSVFKNLFLCANPCNSWTAFSLSHLRFSHSISAFLCVKVPSPCLSVSRQPASKTEVRTPNRLKPMPQGTLASGDSILHTTCHLPLTIENRKPPARGQGLYLLRSLTLIILRLAARQTRSCGRRGGSQTSRVPRSG